MPQPKTSIAIATKPGCLFHERRAYRMSCRKCFMARSLPVGANLHTRMELSEATARFLWDISSASTSSLLMQVARRSTLPTQIDEHLTRLQLARVYPSASPHFRQRQE